MLLLTRNWRNSGTICALADGERHLGHIVRIGGRWHAFDGTHINDSENGFRGIGSFASSDGAKLAVEQATGRSRVTLAGAA